MTDHPHPTPPTPDPADAAPDPDPSTPAAAPTPGAPAGATRPRWTTEKLKRLGEKGLRAHLTERATWAHLKYGRLTVETVPQFLQDPECVRHPTRLSFGFGGMAMHQFAQPAPDPDDPAGQAVVLHLRPTLEQSPDLVPFAVAYMIPLINYGEAVVTDEHCLLYGATLMGQLEDEYYAAVCRLADTTGATPRFL